MARRICLVVDDEAVVRAYIANLLRREGFKLLEADGGVEALNLVRLLGTKLSLVVSDIRMEHGDGITLTKAVRKEFPSLPIVLVTGYSDNREQLAALGVELVEKPFRPETLLKAISTALDAKRTS